jgi:hypothetical protein
MKTEAQSTILSVAAKLLTVQVSDNPDDYPKSMPKWVLKIIEQHNNKQRDWAVELRSAYDNRKKTTSELVNEGARRIRERRNEKESSNN